MLAGNRPKPGDIRYQTNNERPVPCKQVYDERAGWRDLCAFEDCFDRGTHSLWGDDGYVLLCRFHIETIVELSRENQPKHILYRHFNEFGELLYVGITLDPSQRMKGHKKSEWYRELMNGGSTTYECFSSRDELVAAERIAIQTECPMYNKMHAPVVTAVAGVG